MCWLKYHLLDASDDIVNRHDLMSNYPHGYHDAFSVTIYHASFLIIYMVVNVYSWPMISKWIYLCMILPTLYNNIK